MPGFDDSNGKDQEYIDEIFKEFKKLGNIDKFVLVIKGTERVSGIVWEMLAIYREMFGKCWENLIMVVTGLDFNSDDHESL